MGLEGLMSQADTKLGPSTRAADQGAGLHKDYADADYMYDKDGNDTKMATALAKYLSWQKALLMGQAYEISCWKKVGANGPNTDYISGDKYANCAKGDNVATGPPKIDYYPLM